MHAYADDIQSYKTFHSHDPTVKPNLIVSDLDNLVKISKAYGLYFKPSKGQLMLFGHKNQRYIYMVTSIL